MDPKLVKNDTPNPNLDNIELNISDDDNIASSANSIKHRKTMLKSNETPVYDSMISMFDDFAANRTAGEEVSEGHGFEVGDMVWGKVKSHPWWPGHIFSEDFATPSVRRAKKDGLLLVAFFGDSSYGWFDPSELIPFDENFGEKYRQTNSRTFVKAVEEATDEVSRRSALGLSCMCRSKDNFRKTHVDEYFAVDVVDYEPGAVYSIYAIGKARDGFKPSSALDFVRQLALEPMGSEKDGIDFIKNKAKVVSYRRAVYEEFDETYAQAFGHDPVRPSPGSVKDMAHRKTPSKVPLSGRQVFADTSGEGKNLAKLNKPNDHAKKDKYLFKRRDESKDVKVKKKEKVKETLSPQDEDDVAVAAGDFVLQKRISASHEQVGSPIANDELRLKDSSMEEPTGLQTIKTKIDDSSMEEPTGLQTIKTKVEEDDDQKMAVSQAEDRRTSSNLVNDKSSNENKVFTQKETSNSGPNKTIASQRADNGPKKVKVSKRPAGELVSEKKKKRKKEQLVDKEKVSTKKRPIEDPNRTDSKPTTSLPSHTSGTKESNHEIELPCALGDLYSVALDPFKTINRGRLAKSRQVFLKFRSLVFQKSISLSPPSEDEGTDITQSSKSSQNGVQQQATSLGRHDDPSKGGRKWGPSDRQEEMAARKKKKVGDIRNLTKEKKVIKKIDEPLTRDVKQPVVTALKKSGPEFIKKTEQRAPEPTMLMMKFPPGGSLPSMNELKARFARYGPMDHSATRIFWKTFTCRVVYRYKTNAQAAYRFVVESSSLFGNTGVKCLLKEVGVVGSSKLEPPVKVPKEEHQLAMEDRLPAMVPASPSVQLKSILKKSGGEEAVGNGGRGRVKFMLGGDGSPQMKDIESMSGSSSFSSTSHATLDFNSKNFQKGVLPLPNSTTVTSSTTQFTRPLPNSINYGRPLAPPPQPPPLAPPQLAPQPQQLPPPPPRPLNYGSEMAKPTPAPPLAPPPGNFVHNLIRPNIGPPPIPKVDISQQMLSLLTKCNDVVANVANVLGYVPYHPL